MQLLKSLKESVFAKEFNAIIEGNIEPDEVEFKAARLEIPEDITILKEQDMGDENKYLLYGTGDFDNIQKVDFDSLSSKEMDIERLGSCKGAILPYDGWGSPNFLLKTRTVCMEDGRIFVREDYLKEEKYMKILSEIVEVSGEIFLDKDRFNKQYKKGVKFLENVKVSQNRYFTKETIGINLIK